MRIKCGQLSGTGIYLMRGVYGPREQPDVQRYPDDTGRAPAKPLAQPVGMTESKRKRTSWQKPCPRHSAHRRAIFKCCKGLVGPHFFKRPFTVRNHTLLII